MAWIKVRGENELSSEDATLLALYERARDPSTGQLDNIMSIHSLHPAGLNAHFELYSTAMRPTRGLRGADREMIALTVSLINECHY